jgi:hypothetical protein
MEFTEVRLKLIVVPKRLSLKDLANEFGRMKAFILATGNKIN